MKRHRFNPDRIKPRTAAERRHRKLVDGVLKMLRREIRDEKRKANTHSTPSGA